MLLRIISSRLSLRGDSPVCSNSHVSCSAKVLHVRIPCSTNYPLSFVDLVPHQSFSSKCRSLLPPNKGTPRIWHWPQENEACFCNYICFQAQVFPTHSGWKQSPHLKERDQKIQKSKFKTLKTHNIMYNLYNVIYLSYYVFVNLQYGP